MLEELDKLLGLYAETFDDGFPMYQLGRTRSTEEVIGIIKRCLDEQKDAYQLGLVTADSDIDY